MEKSIDKLQERYGAVKELLLPSGRQCIIREQTGEDDEIISRLDSDGSASVNHFIRNIVVYDSKIEGRLQPDDVMDMLLRDKYYILISSRVFSLGNILKFNNTWPGDEFPVSYEQDLLEYIPQYSSISEDSNISKYAIHQYKIPTYDFIEFTTSTGKKMRYRLLNGKSEKYLLRLSENQRNINSELRARKLQIELDSHGWTDVESFAMFSSSEMREIRGHVQNHDARFDGLMEIQNPNSGEIQIIAILGIPDFFFPRGI